MRFTFAMYDFDGDGYITPEDVRIMMSYMPFDRNVKIQNVHSLIEQRAHENMPQMSGMSSPSSMALSRVQQRAKQKEGLYQDYEGKNMDYRDRMNDQEEIRNFIQTVFNSGYAGCAGDRMDYS